MTRRGLVLGAGGVLGAAWTIGALDALAEVEGFAPHEADVIVGTSAGSVLAALLGSGLTAHDLLDHQRGMPLSARAGAGVELRRLDRRRAPLPAAAGRRVAGAAAPVAWPGPGRCRRWPCSPR